MHRSQANSVAKLQSSSITCIASFEGISWIGTKAGTLIIYSEGLNKTSKKEYNLAKAPLLSIYVYQRQDIRVIISFREKFFIRGRISGNEFEYKKRYCQNISLQKTRYINDNGSPRLVSTGYND